MQSIQKLNRFIVLFLYFTIYFLALFIYDKKTKDKIDLAFESIAWNCTNGAFLIVWFFFSYFNVVFNV